MKAKDTVIKKQWMSREVKEDQERLMLEQAEISFKSGIKEVVGVLHFDISRQIGKDGETVVFKLPAEIWQAKLEEWGIE